MKLIIKTQYISATNTRGSKIKATAAGHTLTIPYPYKLSGLEVYAAAARAWIKKHMAGPGIDENYIFALQARYDDKTGYSFEVK